MAVKDLDVARHRAHLRLGQERGHQVAERVRVDDAVGIQGHQYFPSGLGKAGVKGLLFAQVGGKADGFQEMGEALLGLGDIGPGIIRGAVVNADDFQAVRRVIRRGHGVDSLLHHGPFIIGGNNYGHRRPGALG